MTRPGSQPAKILVVDDEGAIRDLLVELFSDEGYVVRAASNGRVAVSMVLDEPPDLIMMDVMMPELNGPETLKHLRTLPSLAQVPVILMSAARYVSSDGASNVAFIPKPFNLDDVLQIVARMLRPAPG
jgi:CheY-like chemotaxis protein